MESKGLAQPGSANEGGAATFERVAPERKAVMPPNYSAPLEIPNVSPATPRWRTIKTFNRSDGEKVTLWLAWGASALTMCWADAFAVRDCWREQGQWKHIYRGKPECLGESYILYWLPADAEPETGPRNTPLDWWRG